MNKSASIVTLPQSIDADDKEDNDDDDDAAGLPGLPQSINVQIKSRTIAVRIWAEGNRSSAQLSAAFSA